MRGRARGGFGLCREGTAGRAGVNAAELALKQRTEGIRLAPRNEPQAQISVILSDEHSALVRARVASGDYAAYEEWEADRTQSVSAEEMISSLAARRV